MDYQYIIQQSYCWYDNKTKIVKMYFIEGIPFTFDDIDDEYSEEIIDSANNEISWEPEDLYLKSFYLIDEEIHPCLFPVNIKNPEDMPKD